MSHDRLIFEVDRAVVGINMFRFSILILFIASVVGGGVYYRHRLEARADEHRFRTEKIERGDLNITVDATGTIEPEEVVDVGAQVTGRIAELAKIRAVKPIQRLRTNRSTIVHRSSKGCY